MTLGYAELFLQLKIQLLQGTGHEVVITGGVVTRKTVSRYNKDGWVEDMPSLNQGRTVHGCTTFVSLGEQVGLPI